ncbi:hypothetical protein GA0061087_10335 [Priestia flexa]|nr:hypothetical protein GA0061087_10335 [Priestia flexa]
MKIEGFMVSNMMSIIYEYIAYIQLSPPYRLIHNGRVDTKSNSPPFCSASLDVQISENQHHRQQQRSRLPSGLHRQR